MTDPMLIAMAALLVVLAVLGLARRGPDTRDPEFSAGRLTERRP